MGSLQSVDQIVSSRFPLKGLIGTSSSSVEIAFIYVQTLWTRRMMVTTLIRCPRARLRLEYDDKSCASSDGPKVVCS